jgi:hypothetical protein
MCTRLLLWLVNYNVFVVIVWHSKVRVLLEVLQIVAILQLDNKLSAALLCNPVKCPDPVDVLKVEIGKHRRIIVHSYQLAGSLVNLGLALLSWRVSNPCAFANERNRLASPFASSTNSEVISGFVPCSQMSPVYTTGQELV